jgi:hypothetical protein
MSANSIYKFIITCNQQQDTTGNDDLVVSTVTANGDITICTIPIQTGEVKSMDDFVSPEDSRRLISDGDYIRVHERDLFDADDSILTYQVQGPGQDFRVAESTDTGNSYSYLFQIEIV